MIYLVQIEILNNRKVSLNYEMIVLVLYCIEIDVPTCFENMGAVMQKKNLYVLDTCLAILATFANES